MSKPESFISSSDYATLKNDATGTVSVTFPGSQTIAANGIRSFSTDIKLGVKGASLRARIASSKNSNLYYSCSSLAFSRNGLSSGFTAMYSIYGVISRSSADTITVYALVLNPYSASLTTASGDETFTFVINTFLPPFA